MDEGDPWAVWREERALLVRVCRVGRILALAEADGRDHVAAWARAALDGLVDG